MMSATIPITPFVAYAVVSAIYSCTPIVKFLFVLTHPLILRACLSSSRSPALSKCCFQRLPSSALRRSGEQRSPWFPPDRRLLCNVALGLMLLHKYL